MWDNDSYVNKQGSVLRPDICNQKVGDQFYCALYIWRKDFTHACLSHHCTTSLLRTYTPNTYNIHEG